MSRNLPRTAPATRADFERAIFNYIDSAFVGLDDVVKLAAAIEAMGVSFMPTASLPPGFVNPYATDKGVTHGN